MSVSDPSSSRTPVADACLLLRDALIPGLRVACLHIGLHDHIPGEPPDGLVLLAEHILARLQDAAA